MSLSSQVHLDSTEVVPGKFHLPFHKNRSLRHNKFLECPHPCPPFVLHHLIQSLETFRVVVMADPQVDIVSLRITQSFQVSQTSAVKNFIFAEPDDHIVCQSVNVTYKADLDTFLFLVGVIDANNVQLLELFNCSSINSSLICWRKVNSIDLISMYTVINI